MKRNFSIMMKDSQHFVTLFVRAIKVAEQSFRAVTG